MSADGGVKQPRTIQTFQDTFQECRPFPEPFTAAFHEQLPPQRTEATEAPCYKQALNEDLDPSRCLWTSPQTRGVEQLLIHPLNG